MEINQTHHDRFCRTSFYRPGTHSHGNDGSRVRYNETVEAMQRQPIDDLRKQMVNCMLNRSKVVLSRIDEGDMINKPLGKANVSHETLFHNHLTLFWIATYEKQTDIVSQELEKGIGFLFESSMNGTWILQDDSKQLDFHV